ncbi:MAG: hypothetical protein ABIR59_05215, partial [Gemmatimonadales bacterium]
MDGLAIIFLNPLLTHLFGEDGALARSNTALDRWLSVILDPFTGTGAPVTRNLVLLFLGALLIKNVASYVAAYVSVLVQEGLV